MAIFINDAVGGCGRWTRDASRVARRADAEKKTRRAGGDAGTETGGHLRSAARPTPPQGTPGLGSGMKFREKRLLH